MAKGWKATTNIQYGDPQTGEVTRFKAGDTVEGLPNDQMAQLWEAGALEETAVADKESSDSTAADDSTPATVESTKPAEGGGTEGTPAT